MLWTDITSMKLGNGVSEDPHARIEEEVGTQDVSLEKYRDFISSTKFYYRIYPLIKLADWAFNHLENAILYRKLNLPIKSPIFPLGNFRSGTSLLEKVLADHVDVGSFTYTSQIFPRSPYITGRTIAAFPAMDQPMLPIHLPKPITINSPYEGEAIWRFCSNNCWTDASTNVLDGAFTDPQFERVLKRTINKVLAAQNKTRFINKNPWNTLRVGYLARLFPDAKFIYIVRHPARMVRSQVELERLSAKAWAGLPRFNQVFSDQFAPPRIFFRTKAHAEIAAAHSRDPVLGTAMSVVDFDDNFEAEVAKANLGDRILRIRYEDLMADFSAEMGKIFAYVDLEIGGGGHATSSNAQSYLEKALPSNTKKVPEFSQEVKAVLRPLMEKYGYAD